MIDIRHWLLDAAAELAIPLRILGAPNVGEILNRKSHGLATPDLALWMEDLIERGEIETGSWAERQPVRTRLSHEEILRSLDEDRWAASEPCYGLTQRGGAEWEDWARPQWSRYTTTCERNNIHGIGAATEGYAEELLEIEKYLKHQRAIIHSSVRRRTFRNWRATYWKTLPEGHLIAFRTGPLPRSDWSPMPHREWARWVDLRKFYLLPADCGF